MAKAEKEPKDMLGVWAEDPRSVAGVNALGRDFFTRPASYNLETWASREFMESESDDPRVVATRAAVRDARLPERLFMPGGYLRSRT